MIESLIELVLELLLQIGGEILCEFGIRALVDAIEERPKAWLAAVGYSMMGAVAGGLSVLVSPHLVKSSELRLLNLAITPVIAGLLMAGIGAWRRRRGSRTIRLDGFWYGYLFALTFALSRYFAASSH